MGGGRHAQGSPPLVLLWPLQGCWTPPGWAGSCQNSLCALLRRHRQPRDPGKDSTSTSSLGQSASEAAQDSRASPLPKGCLNARQKARGSETLAGRLKFNAPFSMLG